MVSMDSRGRTAPIRLTMVALWRKLAREAEDDNPTSFRVRKSTKSLSCCCRAEPSETSEMRDDMKY